MKTTTPLCASRTLRTLLAATLLFVCAGPAAAQKDKKKKKDPPPGSVDLTPMVPMGDQQRIDYLISEMLGAWQIGDIEKLRKDYADDVSVVSGAWTPPIFGWQSYLAAYQAQRGRMQRVRLDRSNTYIKVEGNFAWAAYQWDFEGTVDGQPMRAQGQTTLVLEKKETRWAIVHNHTSIVQSGALPTGPAPAPTPAEGAKPPAS